MPAPKEARRLAQLHQLEGGMPGGRATTRHADSALRSTKRAACAAAVGPERRDDERLRHERKLVDGRDPIGFRRASVIGVIGEWAFDHRRIGRSTAGLGRHLPQHTKSGCSTMVSVKSTPEITGLQFHCNFTAISLADFRLRAICQVDCPDPTTFPATCTLDARARRRHSGRHLPRPAGLGDATER